MATHQTEQTVLLETLGRLYDAATDALKWPAALEAFADLFNSKMAQINIIDLRTQEFIVALIYGMDYSATDFQRYAQLTSTDPVYRRGMELGGKPLSCRVAATTREIHASAIYREALRPAGIEYRLAAAIEFGSDNQEVGILGLARGPEGPAYDAEDDAFYGTLTPHLRRVFELSRSLRQIDSALSPQAAALDALAIGIVLTDANGAILHRNRAAQEIMSGDGLAVRNNHVIARDSGEHELLLAAIKRMALAAQHEAPTAGELLTIHREAPVQRLALVVSPLRAGTGSSMHRPAQAMLLVRDPQRRLESPEEMLWRLFGLTPAEARLTHALVRGLSLKDAANELGVTRHTARDRLSAVFRKTETHRQSELVQTVLNHPVWLVEMGRSQLPSV